MVVSPLPHIAKIGDAGSHHGQVHLDEIILDSARLCRVKDFLPIESALTYRHDLPRLGRPALQVHGDKTARVFGEVLGRIVSLADSRDLELELDVPPIEELKQKVIGPLA